MAVVANCFHAIVAMHTLAMITSSEMYAIKWCIYLVCTLCDKMYQAVSLLSRESLQMGLLCKCLGRNFKYVYAMVCAAPF